MFNVDVRLDEDCSFNLDLAFILYLKIKLCMSS